MPDQSAKLLERIAGWDRAAFEPTREQAERRRLAIVDEFPLADWPTLELERYALGTSVHQSLCWHLEFGTAELGSIRGGAAFKHIIFKRGSGEWYFPDGFATVEDAWKAFRGQMVEAFRLVADDDFDGISALPMLQNGSLTVAKAISVYFPDSLLPAFARAHRDHFVRLFGSDQDGGEYAWQGCRRLLEVVRRRRPELDAWSPLEIMHFLYQDFSPVDTTAIVKVAPGPNADLWPDCALNGYIRIGWDQVGDIEEYASREAFDASFSERYAEHYKGHKGKISEKASEVWTFFDLKPGDIVVANRGTSRIVGIGTVTEDGYAFRPELGNYCQTVAVDWHDRTEREIDSIKRWAFKTVAKVSQADYQRILKGRTTTNTSGKVQPPLPPPPPDPLMDEIERAVTRKGQVILFGPPGTGKTYGARRFTVWWLAKRRGEPDANGLLADEDRFKKLEAALSTAATERRVWWVVANPAQWSWEQLFTAGSVDYHYGRLQRNYPLVEAGDLVVGYQSTPDKRIVALARVTEGLHTGPEGPAISIEPLTRVTNGPSYAELANESALSDSEPMRFRNQGTLFGLTSAEADHVLAWLRERDPSLDSLSDEAEGAIGPLTRVTFHPSYAYEDFVEGYKPQATSTGQIDLRLTDGVFKKVCRAAAADPEHDYILLIDEINRGNIPKIFGELITLLERDKRGVSIVLPQSREGFSVPLNLYVIGTMNTADRSIRLLDAALRRRFAFIELMPDSGPLEGGQVGELDLAVFLTELNRRVARLEGREKQIGHSFLLDDGQPVDEAGRFAQLFRHEILPLLQEYAYDDYRELAEYIGPGLVDVEEQRIRPDVLGDADALIHALAAHLMPKDSVGSIVDDAAMPVVPLEG